MGGLATRPIDVAAEGVRDPACVPPPPADVPMRFPFEPSNVQVVQQRLPTPGDLGGVVIHDPTCRAERMDAGLVIRCTGGSLASPLPGRRRPDPGWIAGSVAVRGALALALMVAALGCGGGRDPASADGGGEAPTAGEAGRDGEGDRREGAPADGPDGNADRREDGDRGSGDPDSGPPPDAPEDAGASPDAGPADLPPLGDPGPLYCGRPGLVFSGQERTLEVFPIVEGLLIVRERSLLLVDRTGQVRRSVTMDRDVVAAAFDGTTLAVVDRAVLQRFRVDLARTDSRFLLDFCDSALSLPGGGTQCGAPDLSPRILYPTEAAAVPSFVGEGTIPALRLVPGRGHLVGPGSGGFVYYVPAPNGRLEPRAASGYPSEIRSGPFFAFAGHPATHVIDLAGSLFRLPEAECQQTAYPSMCFAPEGKLDTLMTGQAYVGLVEDSPATVLALVRTGSISAYDPPCLMGCDVQRIDVAAKKILGQRTHRIDAKVIRRLRHDPFCDRLLVLSRTTDDSAFPLPYQVGGDYRVHLLDWAEAAKPVDPPAGLPPPPPGPSPPAPIPDGTRSCAPPAMLYEGPEAPLSVHGVAEGVLIATASAVSLVGRDGAVKVSVAATGKNTAVAFDGARLVVADSQPGLTLFAPGTLAPVSRLSTTEACGGLVLMDGPRLICGGTADVNRVFYTLDLESRAEIARSGMFTYRGLPMLRVPGKSQFITTNLTTTARDYGLFEVGGGGAVTLVNPNFGHRAGLGGPFAFLENPAERIVASSGALARIEGPDCPPSGLPQLHFGCFSRDGQLGVNRPGQYHLAVTSDAAGAVYALTSPETRTTSENRCTDHCLAQKIDVASRRIVSSRPVRLVLEEAIGASFDAACGHLLVSYLSTSPLGGSRNFRVNALDYRAPEGTP
jgi:hypothetical protein